LKTGRPQNGPAGHQPSAPPAAPGQAAGRPGLLRRRKPAGSGRRPGRAAQGDGYFNI